jgi:hypothetical protein
MAGGLTRQFDYYPPVEIIYKSDLDLTLDGRPEHDVADTLMNLREGDPSLAAILRSGTYYDAVGHTDAVYRVLRTLEAVPTAIPRYTQIVVDEYPDFSLLEKTVIDVLATVSPTLIVGDDDQALYHFKHASANYIRQLARDRTYAQFVLPYCTRCTEVLVAATHLVVEQAQRIGLLRERIAKPYECFLPDKREDSERYPRITHAHCTVNTKKTPYIARYISGQVSVLVTPDDIVASREGGHPTVLVIGPKHVGEPVYRYLASRHPNVDYKFSNPMQLRPLDGYRRVAADPRLRLGWRILLECHYPTGWEQWVRTALIEDAEIAELISDTYRTPQLELASLISRLVESEELEQASVIALEGVTGMAIAEVVKELGVGLGEEAGEEKQENGTGGEQMATQHHRFWSHRYWALRAFRLSTSSWSA